MKFNEGINATVTSSQITNQIHRIVSDSIWITFIDSQILDIYHVIKRKIVEKNENSGARKK